MPVYYNDNNEASVSTLRELISAGLLPDGFVDSRSICDVEPDDLTEFNQCHFFAGIGGWPLALMLSGWKSDDHVWSASCPCQPFSVGGKKLGEQDERNLWPEIHRIIKKRKPVRIIGEQVAGKNGLAWWDRVSSDLGLSDYTCGAIAAEASVWGVAAQTAKNLLVGPRQQPETTSIVTISARHSFGKTGGCETALLLGHYGFICSTRMAI